MTTSDYARPIRGPSNEPRAANNTTRTRDLNDRFRRRLLGGMVMMTQGVSNLDSVRIATLINQVRRFDAFTPDNDPHGEHDFGAFYEGGDRFFWKIDYYDKQMEFGSPDTADPDVTTRVLTLMLAEEY